MVLPIAPPAPVIETAADTTQTMPITPGFTYWQASVDTGVSVAAIEADNPWEAHVLPVGGLMKIPAQGQITVDPTGDTASAAPASAPAPPPPAPSIVAGSDAQNLVTIAQQLIDHGFTANAASGIAADIAGESGGDPESVGSGGCGLIGWTPCSVQVTGNANADLAVQIQDIINYVAANGSEADMNMNSGSVEQAADHFSSQYERPAVLYSDVRLSEGLWVRSQV